MRLAIFLMAMSFMVSGCDNTSSTAVENSPPAADRVEINRPMQSEAEMILVYDNKKHIQEYKTLDGSWAVASLHHRENLYSSRDLVGSGLPQRVIFTKEPPVRIHERCDVYTIDIDPTVRPKRLTATIAGGEIKGQRLLGIYGIQGDLLSLKLSELGSKNFPIDFVPIPEDDAFLMILKRLGLK